MKNTPAKTRAQTDQDSLFRILANSPFDDADTILSTNKTLKLISLRYTDIETLLKKMKSAEK